MLMQNLEQYRLFPVNNIYIDNGFFGVENYMPKSFV